MTVQNILVSLANSLVRHIYCIEICVCVPKASFDTEQEKITD